MGGSGNEGVQAERAQFDQFLRDLLGGKSARHPGRKEGRVKSHTWLNRSRNIGTYKQYLSLVFFS